MSLVRIVFEPDVDWSTTARRNGTSTWPGPPAGPTMTRPSTPIFITNWLPTTLQSRAARTKVP